jgi:small subunit ribosomal protein S16
MVRIRLRRVGAKHQPSFRIVAADKESPRDGRFLEILGHYNPRTKPATVDVDEARLYHWLTQGAQPSDSTLQVLKAHGAWDRWLRLKQGESMEALLDEAKAAITEVDSRTDRVEIKPRRQSRKARAKAEVPQGAEASEAAQPGTTAESVVSEAETEQPESRESGSADSAADLAEAQSTPDTEA